MTKKTASKLPKDFSLYPRQNGQYAKKIKGTLHYFGVIADPEAAWDKYLDERDDLQAGRVPRKKLEDAESEKTVLYMANSFLAWKEDRKNNNHISDRTYAEYLDICQRIVKEFGKNRLLTDIKIEDFEQLRKRLAVGPVTGKKISSVRHGNLIRRVHTVFKYANAKDLIDRPIKVGPEFQGPSKKALRGDRKKRGKRMLTADELRRVIDGAKPVMRAMILLGINAGFGNTDVSQLPIPAIDFQKGWIDFPRPKTGVDRRCPLWPETVEALKIAKGKRPRPKNEEHKDLLFVTKYGAQFVRTGSTGGAIDSVYAEFAKLLKTLKLNRANLGFYAIRHTFQTVGGGSLDPAAVSSIMGHSPHASDMAAVYTEEIPDARLKAVTNHVRKWLWPKSTKGKAKKATKST